MMSDYRFYIKRENSEVSAQPSDLPHKAPKKTPERSPSPFPSDLPLPRHRPGEPIMYDPPANGVEIFPMQFPNDREVY